MIQILLLVVAVGIVVSSIDFKKLYNNIQNKELKQTEASVDTQTTNDHEDKIELVDVVSLWEEFKNVCEKLELKDAVVKLDEIFPMLIKAEKE